MSRNYLGIPVNIVIDTNDTFESARIQDLRAYGRLDDETLRKAQERFVSKYPLAKGESFAFPKVKDIGVKSNVVTSKQVEQKLAEMDAKKEAETQAEASDDDLGLGLDEGEESVAELTAQEMREALVAKGVKVHQRLGDEKLTELYNEHFSN